MPMHNIMLEKLLKTWSSISIKFEKPGQLNDSPSNDRRSVNNSNNQHPHPYHHTIHDPLNAIQTSFIQASSNYTAIFFELNSIWFIITAVHIKKCALSDVWICEITSDVSCTCICIDRVKHHAFLYRLRFSYHCWIKAHSTAHRHHLLGIISSIFFTKDETKKTPQAK